MKTPEFPKFIQNLPEADLPVDGIRGWLLNSNNGQVLFLRADRKSIVPEHTHGDQWGIVVEGEMELTIGNKAEIYRPGNSYFIPAGTTHKAIIYKGFCALDYFADSDRYKSK